MYLFFLVLADMWLHMVADKVAGIVADMGAGMVADMAADKKNLFFVLGRHVLANGERHGGRQGGRHGGWSRVLVNWAQFFSTQTLPTDLFFAWIFPFCVCGYLLLGFFLLVRC